MSYRPAARRGGRGPSGEAPRPLHGASDLLPSLLRLLLAAVCTASVEIQNGVPGPSKLLLFVCSAFGASPPGRDALVQLWRHPSRLHVPDRWRDPSPFALTATRSRSAG